MAAIVVGGLVIAIAGVMLAVLEDVSRLIEYWRSSR